MTTDYKDTVFLPKTDFPMRGGLPQKEPEILALWEKLDIYGQLARRTGESFTLHDGPPYANGNIHIGHAANKILKDVVNRSQAMRGRRINYIPGWDCHGLPIEWKIEEQYRAKGKDKDQVPVLQFRAECRDFARHWVGVQSAEFQRLGIAGDWANPYMTMHNDSEARIAAEIHKFLMNGSLYQGERSVMWSTVEKTALADAEVEYHDHKSDTIWVGFTVVETGKTPLKPEIANIRDELLGAQVIIWTTTPWTIPANRAIAYGLIDYAFIKVTEVDEGSTVQVGQKFLLGSFAVEEFQRITKIKAVDVLHTFNPGDSYTDLIFSAIKCEHPLAKLDAAYKKLSIQLFFGQHGPTENSVTFVVGGTGSGFVQIAPSHGLDDFLLGKKHGLEIPYTVEGDGRYAMHLPLFGGASVYRPDGKKGDANQRVMAALEQTGALLAKSTVVHSYPHSWRSKAPLIFRTTPQWFIAMDIQESDARSQEPETIRVKALTEIEKVRWIPEASKNRIKAMVETRPDWCISRQRAWGVPIAIFVDKKTRAPLRDTDVCARIVAAFERDGSDAWFTRNAQEFLGEKYAAADYDQVFDIVDVWFESGSTHAFVCEARDIETPVDLYLEGSDQHRGWFQSSLLESVGTRGRAPFKAVLTHGYVLDEQGRKMSKSLGNVIAPEKVIAQYGADILRLWVCNIDTMEDVRIGNEILKQQTDLYRRLRNTLRYLLGALNDFDPAVKVDPAAMPELERWVLHRLHEMDAHVRACLDNFDYNKLFTALHEFCNTDLSAFYFDVRKDSLYCDARTAPRRQAALWTLNQVFLHLTAWLAPILSFTCEEAWQHYPHRDCNSVHLRLFPAVPAAWRNDALGAEWQTVRAIRSMVTSKIETMRADKMIGSSLETNVALTVPLEKTKALLEKIDFRDICIVSSLPINVGEAPLTANVTKITGAEKCERCRQYLLEVGEDKAHPTLCHRCADAVVEQQKLAA